VVNIKLKASILPYSLILMVVVSIILSSLILLSYFNKLNINRFRVEDRLRSNAQSGINILLSSASDFEYDQAQFISLYGEINDSVELLRTNWGFFEMFKSKAHFKNLEKEKVVLAGNYYKNLNGVSIYLQDLDRPLCLIGKSKIIGNARLPYSGIKRGYIDGRHFQGKKLLDGEIDFSERKLPINKKLIERNNQLSLSTSILFDPLITQIRFSEIDKDSICNSFYNPTILIYSKESIILDHLAIKGNVIIYSEKQIIIGNQSDIKDVLIYAKSIFVESELNMTGQLIASDSLIISENCNFNYPSAIATINYSDTYNEVYLKIGKGTQIEGNVLSYSHNDPYKSTINIRIEEGVEITGQLLSNSNLEFFGSIKGSLIARNTMIRRPSGIYVNHLLDVEINYTGLEHSFVTSDLHDSQMLFKPMKWLK